MRPENKDRQFHNVRLVPKHLRLFGALSGICPFYNVVMSYSCVQKCSDSQPNGCLQLFDH